MRPTNRALIGWIAAWCLIAAVAGILAWVLSGCATVPPSPVSTTTTTTLSTFRAILAGNPTAGTEGSSSAVKWYVMLAATGGGMLAYAPLAAWGAPVAVAGVVGGLLSLGIAQHGTLLGWLVCGAVVVGLVVVAVLALRRSHATAESTEKVAEGPMEALEEHKDALIAILVDPANPKLGTLWDRITDTVAEKWQAAGVDDRGKASLVKLGFSKPK